MANGLNKVLLIGNTAAEPDFRVLSNNGSNTNIATVGLATNESHKDATGNLVEQTEWHRLVFWGRQAEIVRDYCHKGSLIYVEGKIKTRSYEDQQGQKRYSTEIHVQELKLLGGKSQGGNAGGDQWGGQQQPASQQWGGQQQAQAPGWTQQQPAAAPQQWGGQPQQQPYQQPQGYQQAPAAPAAYQQAPAAPQQQYGYQPAFRSAPPAGAVPIGPAPAAAPQQPQPAPQPQVAPQQPSPAAFQAPQAQAPAAADGNRPFKDDDLPF